MLGTEVIGSDLAEGRLVPLLVDEVPPRELPIHVVYTSRRHLSAKVRSFVDFLAARFANESLWPSLDEIRALAVR
jgi:DNA-binding transcriptional LysR family regulator